ncbi:uncharacterized protein [Chelonus insularis]|uniref:uncharacterized protein n=1 Tax=Chelonus insularis TaxID=460826 RepID=UPI00158C421A|nr:uncharacterized protein LOC118068905 [Chelonus insularis]
MPACTSDNSLHLHFSSPQRSRSSSSSPLLPSSPIFNSPPEQITMISTKRSTSDVSYSSKCSSWHEASSTLNPSKGITNRRRENLESQLTNHTLVSRPKPIGSHVQRGFFKQIIFWYLNIIFKLFNGTINTIIFMMRAPTLWASIWLCIFFVILQLPLTLLKWFITILHTPASEVSRNKRCVLISGGSTVQAVHLARNFYRAGARVVVCEVEGLFSLCRFSIACSKFYTIPRPGPGNVAEYVKALKNIVEKEKVVYYIPVSSTNPAYYDALAKPHLKLLGCECFIPNAIDVTILDNPLELLKRCQSIGLAVPAHFIIRSVDDALNLYESGVLRSGRHVMLSAASAGIRERVKVTLPPNAQEFQNIRHDISDKKPWVIIKDPGGSHFITCTTIKHSQIVANVTCRVDETKGLIPEMRNDVTEWLENFFSRSFNCTSVNGHVSFRFVLSENNELVSIGCRVGIGLPYVCFTSIHPRLVWKPCRHFSRQNSGPLLVGETCQSKEKAFPSAVKQATINTTNYFNSAIDKREALFVYWDPLPYCAFYHLQLPFFRITNALRARPRQHNPPLAVIQ